MLTKLRWLRERVTGLWRFVSEDVWDIELSSLSFVRRSGVKAVRVVQLVIRGFREDQCPLHASALTYSTLMSIVPILAVSLALAQGFGAGDVVVTRAKSAVESWTGNFQTSLAATNSASTNTVVIQAPAATNGLQQATDTALPSPDVAALPNSINDVVDWLFEKAGGIDLTAIGGVGLAVLLLTVVLVLGRVEASFNKVWGVTSPRPFYRKFFDYLGVLIILPILVIASSSLQAVDLAAKYVDTETAELIRTMMGTGFLKGVTTILTTTLTFAFLLMFMPNTRVRLRAGLGGGFVSAILFVLWLWVCARMQVGAVKYLKIYASFAVVPIVLFWVFVSWEIVLFGAEVAFALQNCTTYRMETRARAASTRSRLILALTVVAETTKSMEGQAPVFEAAKFAREKRVPVRLLIEVVDALVAAGYVGRLSDREGSFVLLKPPDSVGVKDVIDAMMKLGAEPHELGLDRLSPEIEKMLVRADAGMADALSSFDLRTLTTKT